VVERVKPAVVAVKVNIEDAAASSDDLSGQMDNLPPEVQQFFKRFGGTNGAPRQTQPRHEMALGSGFIISADGFVVTNNHVVQNAKTVTVTTDDGKTVDAKVIGTDPKTDLALLKITEAGDYPFVKLAKETPRIGDWVVAIGNPYGLGGTVTAGIISAEGRDIGSGPYDSFLQIDAPINKGNSGGPAFDVEGNVIGVNTAIYSPSGGSVGIGFDIPADTVKTVVAQLKSAGHVTRGWLGVQIQPVTASIADSLGLKKAEGALVAEPQDGSPAAKAGILSGDVITAVNGTPVKDARELARTIGTIAPNATVKLDLIRGGQAKTISLTLGEMPDQQQANADTGTGEPSSGVPHLGLSVAPASEVSGAGAQGVVVTAVDPDGPAAEQGFQTGTVILDVGGKSVANVGDVRKALVDAKAQGKHQVLLRVKQGDAMRFVALPLGDA
jgi:serine protease Do